MDFNYTGTQTDWKADLSFGIKTSPVKGASVRYEYSFLKDESSVTPAFSLSDNIELVGEGVSFKNETMEFAFKEKVGAIKADFFSDGKAGLMLGGTADWYNGEVSGRLGAGTSNLNVYVEVTLIPEQVPEELPGISTDDLEDLIDHVNRGRSFETMQAVLAAKNGEPYEGTQEDSYVDLALRAGALRRGEVIAGQTRVVQTPSGARVVQVMETVQTPSGPQIVWKDSHSIFRSPTATDRLRSAVEAGGEGAREAAWTNVEIAKREREFGDSMGSYGRVDSKGSFIETKSKQDSYADRYSGSGGGGGDSGRAGSAVTSKSTSTSKNDYGYEKTTTTTTYKSGVSQTTTKQTGLLPVSWTVS